MFVMGFRGPKNVNANDFVIDHQVNIISQSLFYDYLVLVIFKRHFFKGDFPNDNFPNVQFLNRQLPKGRVRPSEAPKAAMGGVREDKGGGSAAAMKNLFSWRFENCTGSIPLGIYPW